MKNNIISKKKEDLKIVFKLNFCMKKENMSSLSLCSLLLYSLLVVYITKAFFSIQQLLYVGSGIRITYSLLLSYSNGLLLHFFCGKIHNSSTKRPSTLNVEETALQE